MILSQNPRLLFFLFVKRYRLVIFNFRDRDITLAPSEGNYDIQLMFLKFFYSKLGLKRLEKTWWYTNLVFDGIPSVKSKRIKDLNLSNCRPGC